MNTSGNTSSTLVVLGGKGTIKIPLLDFMMDDTK